MGCISKLRSQPILSLYPPSDHVRPVGPVHYSLDVGHVRATACGRPVSSNVDLELECVPLPGTFRLPVAHR